MFGSNQTSRFLHVYHLVLTRLTQVADIMSRPPIAAKATNKVADAAVMMLKHKVTHQAPYLSGFLYHHVHSLHSLRLAYPDLPCIM